MVLVGRVGTAVVDIVISERLGGLVVAAAVTGGAILLLRDSCGVLCGYGLG